MNLTKLLDSRAALIASLPPAGQSLPDRAEDAAEGGCGVLGFAANVPVAGRHLVTASRQMHNRGNGKGGGIAAAGLNPAQMRVSPEVLRTHYLIQIAYLDPASRAEVERECITGRFDIAQSYLVDTVDDFRQVPGLEMRPPDVVRYFCRVKPEVLARFAEENGLRHLPARQVEDEYVYQNSFRLNQRYYSSLGEKQAFVLCHGRDLLVFKIVGYAEESLAYYRLEDMTAHVWIAHQRYPTKGRVWHPAGAHPFIGMNEALVHNGDFANYHRVTEYLRQRNIVPLFLTDTEVSALLFDLWDRIYAYPLEVLLEALAPTTERDFDMLPPEKQALYRAIQQTHLHGSPDGPWFFIIARSQPDANQWQLLGITDTSMLRPQVFALYEGEAGVQIGLIASERQAINACLRGLASEDSRFQPLADRYWVARGGSYTDGGAFALTVSRDESGCRLRVEDKFGNAITAPQIAAPAAAEQNTDWAEVLRASVEKDLTPQPPLHAQNAQRGSAEGGVVPPPDGGVSFLSAALPALAHASLEQFAAWTEWLCEKASASSAAGDDTCRARALEIFTRLRDRRYDTGLKKRSAVLALVDRALFRLLRETPTLTAPGAGRFRRVDYDTRPALRAPAHGEQALVVDACGFPPQGEDSAAQLIVQAYALGWRQFIAFDWRGGRFAGCGLGPGTAGVRIDLYGDPGDYLASGLEGGQMHVHADAQDQIGQILKAGRLVIHGDVGQTFLYGAKGGEVYVLGSAAGRPLINAVGRPRVVINGTCLDYLAESFMAGDPLHGGGFAILNGVTFDAAGRLIELDTPYPGGNLFSLASGGAIYLRDPHDKVDEDQLNGGQFAALSDADWALIEPHLAENEALFGITVRDLLTVDGERRAPAQVYRKVEIKSLEVLH